MPEPTFDAAEAALHHYRTLSKTLQDDLDDTKLALDEYRATADDLEKELLREVQMIEQELKQVKGREEKLQSEVENWKSRYQNTLRDHTKSMSHMQIELDSLRKSSEEYRKRIRDMELDNDSLESKERMVASSLQDMESKFGKSIERITLLEEELIEKSKLEEECQRLRDDLRETSEELAIVREQVAQPDLKSSPIASTEDCLSPLGMGATTPSAASLKPDSTVGKRLVSAPVSRSPLSSLAQITSPNSHPVSRSPSHPQLGLKPSPRVVSPSFVTRIPTPTGTVSPSPSNGATTSIVRSGHRRDLSIAAASIPKTRNVHLASLQAETKRMKGLTQKIVSTRNLREVSAIPKPKVTSPYGIPRENGSRTPTARPAGQLSRSSTLKKLNSTLQSSIPSPTTLTTQDDSSNFNKSKVAGSRTFNSSSIPPPTTTQRSRPVSRMSRPTLVNEVTSNRCVSRSPTPSSNVTFNKSMNHGLDTGSALLLNGTGLPVLSSSNVEVSRRKKSMGPSSQRSVMASLGKSIAKPRDELSSIRRI